MKNMFFFWKIIICVNTKRHGLHLVTSALSQVGGWEKSPFLGHCHPVLEPIRVRLPAEGSNEMIRHRIVVEFQCSSSLTKELEDSVSQPSHCTSASFGKLLKSWCPSHSLDGLNHALQLETQAPVFFKAPLGESTVCQNWEENMSRESY